MATLVQFLASGVNGAANGSATFLLRGTASSAAASLYTDFEMTAQPGTNIITLDANGAAEIYCNVYCDVVLKTSAGATLRTVTIGNSATTVEVISDSFTGTDYSGSPTAVNEPITLASVLDKWDNSAGADDWKVAVNGVATNLSAAFSAIGGLFFNVKDPTYGAVGDGVTDDTTAIGLAITAAAAAGGGIVFFPATTSSYIFTTLSIAGANVTLMGTGPRSSILQSASTSTLITFTDNTAGGWKRIIGLGLKGTGASANPILVIDQLQNILVDNVEFNCASFTGRTVSRTTDDGKSLVVMNNCVFNVQASSFACLSNQSNDDQTFWRVTNSKFIVSASFVGTIVLGPDFNVSGCIFDASAVTSGSYTHVHATSIATASKYLGKFVGNNFIDGGSSGTVFNLTGIVTGSLFYEDDNSFSGFTAQTAITSAGNHYGVSYGTCASATVYLGSRMGRAIVVTHAGTGTVIPIIGCNHQNVFINYTGAGNLTIQAPIAVMTHGAELQIVLQNNSGSTRDIVIDFGESVQTYGTSAGAAGPSANSDVTLQPGTGERCVILCKFMHFGSGNPLAYISGLVVD